MRYFWIHKSEYFWNIKISQVQPKIYIKTASFYETFVFLSFQFFESESSKTPNCSSIAS